jgi:hypothetical protein
VRRPVPVIETSKPPSISLEVVAESLSDPDILLGRPLAAHIHRIEHAARLDQEQFDLVLGVRFVLHPLRNDKHLSRPDMHRATPVITSTRRKLSGSVVQLRSKSDIGHPLLGRPDHHPTVAGRKVGWALRLPLGENGTKGD